MTLAHMVRPVVLAGLLDEREFDVVLACDARYLPLFSGLKIRQTELFTIPSADFLRALAKGSPLYSASVLEKYVEQDLEIIDREKPDIIVGDFRLSLAVSARLRAVPYVGISNAYWSPGAKVGYTIPEHPLTELLGVSAANLLFQLARPLVFAAHSLPLNRVSKRYGLDFLSLNLNRAYTEADHVVYADVPQLVPVANLPTNHQFIGPVLWSPVDQYPSWWEEVDLSKPTIYVALGSSGRNDLLPLIVEALGELPVQVMVSTAGRQHCISAKRNVFVADYLPGQAAAARSNLVICNGGSLTTYQAFSHGRAVLGIAGNLDQHLNMQAIESFGAGLKLRTEKVSEKDLLSAVIPLLEDPSFSFKAGVLQEHIRQFTGQSRFVDLLRSM